MFFLKIYKSWKCSSVVEYLPRMAKAWHLKNKLLSANKPCI